jgi:Xaa-Pro aminopeptidase
MTKLVEEKAEQAVGILRELGIDTWIIFSRENVDQIQNRDFETSLVGQGVFIFRSDGEKLAIAASYDAGNLEHLGIFDEVLSYQTGIEPDFKKVIARIKPKKIALDYSEDSHVPDGLSHGMYLVLMKILGNYKKGIRSAAPIIDRLRARKTPEEIKRIKKAIDENQRILNELEDFLAPGQTELEVQKHVQKTMRDRDLPPAWNGPCPIISAGANSAAGHHEPDQTKIKLGDVVRVDFGVKHLGYSSDLQRTYYLQRKGESSAPAKIQRMVETTLDSFNAAVAAMKPGVKGVQVDTAARKVVLKAGYHAEGDDGTKGFDHATGHNVGRETHDAGPILGPLWPRYGERPNGLLEVGHVYAVEPSVRLERVGAIGFEHEVLVTKRGAELLSEKREGLILL